MKFYFIDFNPGKKIEVFQKKKQVTADFAGSFKLDGWKFECNGIIVMDEHQGISFQLETDTDVYNFLDENEELVDQIHSMICQMILQSPKFKTLTQKLFTLHDQL